MTTQAGGRSPAPADALRLQTMAPRRLTKEPDALPRSMWPSVGWQLQYELGDQRRRVAGVRAVRRKFPPTPDGARTPGSVRPPRPLPNLAPPGWSLYLIRRAR